MSEYTRILGLDRIPLIHITELALGDTVLHNDRLVSVMRFPRWVTPCAGIHTVAEVLE